MRHGKTVSFRRQLLAWWLLLLLARVLAPEATVLHLHAHAHTTLEPAAAGQSRRVGRALLTPQHQHCHAEQLYQLPFVPAAAPGVPAPVRRRVYAAYRPQALVSRAPHLLAGACLRGPPTRG